MTQNYLNTFKLGNAFKMGNKTGKCQHRPFDDPCPEPEGQPFVFGGPGLAAIPEEVEQEQDATAEKDTSSNSTEQES